MTVMDTDKEMTMETEKFTDAQEMHRQHLDTFDAPDPADLDDLRLGDFVKVCAGRERFWVRIVEFDCDRIVGTVANALLFTDEHGLDFGDEVRVERRHVYDTQLQDDRAA